MPVQPRHPRWTAKAASPAIARLSSRLWLVTQSRNSHIWQDKNVDDIVNAVLDDCGRYADWRWSVPWISRSAAGSATPRQPR
ncbi:contractile injection system protein, VgrG/Pvc8 family [Massilia sp. SR12]